MKFKSDVIWAALIIITAAVSFYLGTRTGALEAEENLNSILDKKTGEINTLELKIKQLSEELTSRGIFSYPQASIVSQKGDSSATVLIHLNGRDPIEDLEIERKVSTDYSPKSELLSDLGRRGTRASIGTLHAHNPVAFDIENFEKEIAIDLKFKSKGNQWHQYIRAKKAADGEIKTFWIITNEDSEVIDKHIDEEFPVDNDGYFTFGANKKVKYSKIRMNSIFSPYSTD